jgi:hypothetical protein
MVGLVSAASREKTIVRLKVIACEILYRELCAVAARSVNRVDVEFLTKGLHDIGQAGMFGRLNEVLAEVDQSQYDALALGYGLCSNGVVGLAAQKIPLVIPRAHDCITLLLGSKERYLEYFHKHPGVYFKSSGWIERGDGLVQLGQGSLEHLSGMGESYEELVAKYGEDNARYLYEQLSNLTRNYRRLTFIEMGVEPDDRFEQETRQEAAERGWDYDKLTGDMILLNRLVDGPWDEDQFLVVPPGHCVAASFDERVVKAVKQDAPADGDKADESSA